MQTQGVPPPEPTDTAARRATALAASAFLLPAALGYVFTAIIKLINPAGVDVTQGLAYLTEILTVTWGAALIWLVLVVVLLWRVGSRLGRPAVRSAWTVLAVQGVLIVVIIIASLVAPG